jgi:hypothetical protein
MSTESTCLVESEQSSEDSEDAVADRGLRNHFAEVARTIYPRGAGLLCPRCGGGHNVSTAEIATYLQIGCQTSTCCHVTLQITDMVLAVQKS